jgi:hypothetical protein
MQRWMTVKKGANGVLVMEPLIEVEMEEWLAPAPTFLEREDCTEGGE